MKKINSSAAIIFLLGFFTFTACKNSGTDVPAAEPKVLSVTLLDADGNPFTKEQINAPKGSSIQFTVSVEVENNGSKEVSWSVSGGKSSILAGKLSIAADEPNGTVLTVTVQSNADNSKKDSIQVKVLDDGVQLYNININSSTGGTVSVQGGFTQMIQGETVTLNINANQNYLLSSITVTQAGGSTVALSGSGNTQSFTMPAANVIIDTVFVMQSQTGYNINIAAITGGIITVDGGLSKAPAGTSVTLIITRELGYLFDSLSITRSTTGSTVAISVNGNTCTFTMPASDVNISAVFTSAPFYTVTINGPFSNGTVTSGISQAPEGDVITLNITPAAGYRLSSLSITPKAPFGGTSTERNFIMPNENVTVTAVFSLKNEALDNTDGIKIGDTVTGKGKLVWRDEFNENILDLDKWNYDYGGGGQYPQGNAGWGNNEKQWYKSQNVRVENGNLIIEASLDAPGTLSPYGSGRLTTAGTRGSGGQTPNNLGVIYPPKEYLGPSNIGYVEARIKSPRGAGFWPAFWTLGADVNDESGYAAKGWPRCGEVDIFEVNGNNLTRLGQTIHYGASYPSQYWYTSNTTTTANMADTFHTYAASWDSTSLKFYFDGGLMRTISFSSLSGGANANASAFYDETPHVIIINLALGGNYLGGTTPANSVFTSTNWEDRSLQVDWVRIYE